MKAIKLVSERLIYEPLSQDHLSQKYVDWLNDEDVIRYLETKAGYTIELLEEFLAEVEKKSILFWGIHLKETGEHIGNIKIDPINKKDNSGEYGIMMGDKEKWGKGYGKEASNRIIEYCFNEIKLSSITLGVVEDNEGALNLYKKIGFKVEDTMRDTGLYNGKISNTLRMRKNNEK